MTDTCRSLMTSRRSSCRRPCRLTTPALPRRHQRPSTLYHLQPVTDRAVDVSVHVNQNFLMWLE